LQFHAEQLIAPTIKPLGAPLNYKAAPGLYSGEARGMPRVEVSGAGDVDEADAERPEIKRAEMQDRRGAANRKPWCGDNQQGAGASGSEEYREMRQERHGEADSTENLGRLPLASRPKHRPEECHCGSTKGQCSDARLPPTRSPLTRNERRGDENRDPQTAVRRAEFRQWSGSRASPAPSRLVCPGHPPGRPGRCWS